MINQNTVANINLKDVVRFFCANDEQCKYVVDVLSVMECSPEKIKESQATVRDFVNTPALIADFRKAMTELDRIMEERRMAKRLSFHARTVYEANQRKNTKTIFSNLAEVSKIILRFIRLYLNINSVLSKYNFSSNTMIELKKYFYEFATAESFQKFGNVINQLSNVEIGSSKICMNVFLYKKLGEISVKFASLNGETPIPDIKPTEPKDREIINRLTEVAVKDLWDYLNNIAQTMEEKLLSVREQLMFYSFAIRYVEVLQENGLPGNYPDMTESYSDTCFEKLHSIHLVAKNIPGIVPHDVEACNLTVLYGDNNTGKTCYMRGVALAHIFAQAGLPVPAVSGCLCPVSDILSQFAVGEKNLGRFEEEVKEVNEIFNKVDSKTLVMFNETFQSTVYEEIARPFMDILEAIVSAGGHALVVTHNEPFIDLCKERSDVKLLKMNEGHEIEEVLTPKR